MIPSQSLFYNIYGIGESLVAGSGGSVLFTRQKILIHLIRELGGNVSRLSTVKLCFLLSTETESRGGNAFYDFLPYKYGPFSFCLYQEVSRLARDGLIEESKRHLSLTSCSNSLGIEIPISISAQIGKLLETYGNYCEKRLIQYVYQNYPWYTVNSVDDPRIKRPSAEPAIYTAGYEKTSVDRFLDTLLRSGIRTILDIRSNPVSRRYGFHKSTLSRLAENVGLRYWHFPELGITSQRRKNVDTLQDRIKLLDSYENCDLPSKSDFIGEISGLLTMEPSVLVCSELDHNLCHRSRLAKWCKSRTGLPIVHLVSAT